MTIVATTPRLTLRLLTAADAAFVLRQLNQTGWLRFIGDRGVRTLDDAREYLRTRFLGEYERLGYGMYGVGLRDTGRLVGVSGLVKRDYLDVPDLGFALLDDEGGHGYAREAAAAVVQHAERELGLTRLLAICKSDNARSIALLGHLGFTDRGTIAVPPNAELLQLYQHERS